MIDSSVTCKLLLPESYSPDFMHVEVANVLWKRVSGGQIYPLQARIRLMRATRFPITLKPTVALLYSAVEIAVATQQTVYDSCCIALAQFLKAPCITADERWFNALQRTAYRDLVMRLSDL